MYMQCGTGINVQYGRRGEGEHAVDGEVHYDGGVERPCRTLEECTT
jgi:hypothetical protein